MMLAIVSVATVLELLPAPRAVYDASVPSIYRIGAEDPRTDAAVL
jgi:hypothetical protein